MKINEIEEGIDRIAQYHVPHTKKIFSYPPKNQKFLPLPGGSNFLYSITKDRNRTDIKIYTADKEAVGQLEVSNSSFGPVAGVKVNVIYVAEDYQNQGISKALYGIVLTIMKVNLFSGDSQTPGGRRNWLSLVKIPGCEVKGIVELSDKTFKQSKPEDHPPQFSKDIAKTNKALDKKIDTMMQLGGEYLGKAKIPQGKFLYHYFAFDVIPGNGELTPAVQKLVTLYGTGDPYYRRQNEHSLDLDTRLFARWVGN